jgi:serine O-acetyltransferase
MFSIVKNPYVWYRVANALWRWRVPILPALITYFVRWWFACYLHYSTEIGGGLVLGYGGLGVVVHAQARVGQNVHLDQGVTLGGNATEPGAPTLGDRVYVGAGAKILGPIRVGGGSVIGANSVVVEDVPDGSVVAGVPARVIRRDIVLEEFLWHLRDGS